MNIAVLGSSFDPAHNGHLAVAKSVLKSKKIDKIILMPVNIHPFAKKISKTFHRFAMAKLLEGRNIEVSDLELKKNSTSYSIDTLSVLTTQYPNYHFYWIIGSDHLDSFTKWKDWQKIISDFGLVIVARDTQTDIKRRLKKFVNYDYKNIIILDAKDFSPFDISSSEIKKRIKEKKSIKNLVPKSVENYIIKHKLYK